MVQADLLPHPRPDVRGRHEPATHPLGQRSDRGHAQLGPHPGHQPFQAFGPHPPQDLHGHLQADAVVVPAGLEHVLQPQREVALAPGVGEAGGVVPAGQQQLTGEVQQVRVFVPLLLPPGVEGCRAGHVVRHPVVVEVVEHRVVRQEPAGAAASLHVLQVLHERTVVLHEAVPRVPAALHQALTQEHLPGHLPGRWRPHARQRGRPVRGQCHPVEEDLLVHHGGALAGGPVRLPVGPPEQTCPARRGLHPRRVHPGHGAGEEPAGLHQLRRHHPLVGLAAQPRTRPHREACAARPGVLPTPLVPVPHVGQQPHQQGAVDGVGVRGVRAAPQGDDGGRHAPVRHRGGLRTRLQGVPSRSDRAGARQLHRPGVQAQWPGQLAQLGVDVLPLAHPQVVEELGAAHAPERRAGQLALLGAQVAPQVEVGEEVAGGVREPPVEGVGGLLMVRRPLTHVLDGQGRDDHHDLSRAALLLGLEQHPPQPRVDRQARQAPAHRGEPRAPSAGSGRTPLPGAAPVA